MEEDLARKRHVTGLRLATSVALGISFIEIFIAVLTQDGWQSDLASELFRLYTIVGAALYVFVLTFVNTKNYLYFVSAIVFWFLITPWIRVTIFGFDDQVVDYFGTYGARLLDWQFIWLPYLMILAVLLGRFYLSACLIAYHYLLSAFFSSNILLNPKTFFSTDHNQISSDPYAIAWGIFLQNVTVATFSAIALTAIAWNIQKNLKDATKHERSNSVLGRYFSPEVRKEIEKKKGSLDLDEEEEQSVVVMFTDISDFTKISEGMKPKEVLKLLSEYQTRMVAAVFDNEGTVDKFIGDSVMATFGTPYSKGNDAQNAINCLKQMQISMREWEQERKEKNLPIVRHRVGVHYGECFVGNIGSEKRFEYTVIGDTVNVASRICEGCKEVGTTALISEDVMKRISENLDSEKVMNFSVRGRKKKINLHKVLI